LVGYAQPTKIGPKLDYSWLSYIPVVARNGWLPLRSFNAMMHFASYATHCGKSYQFRWVIMGETLCVPGKHRILP